MMVWFWYAWLYAYKRLIIPYINHTSVLATYCMSKRSCSFLYTEFIYTNWQDLLDIQYTTSANCFLYSGILYVCWGLTRNPVCLETARAKRYSTRLYSEAYTERPIRGGAKGTLPLPENFLGKCLPEMGKKWGKKGKNAADFPNFGHLYILRCIGISLGIVSTLMSE